MSNVRISLRAARQNKEYTQAFVAKCLNINKETLAKWERGETEPKITQAIKLSELYEIPLDNIIFLTTKSA